MKITFDAAKRNATLAERGIDFSDAAIVLQGESFCFEDERKAYGEKRMVAYGFLKDHMVVVVFVQRGDTTHIVSMRKANEREQKKYARLGQ